MASRYPTREESGWEPPERGDSRKPRKLARKSRMQPKRPKKWKVDVDGVLSQAAWRELRELVFAREGHRCAKCGKHRRDAYRFDPHHRKLQSQGGRDEAVNLVALCSDCHDWCHLHPEEARRGGWIVPSWADPAKRAVALWDGRLVLLGDDGGYAWEGRL